MSDGTTARATRRRPGQGTPPRTDAPAPLLPDWDGACLHRVVPGLLGAPGRPGRRLAAALVPDARSARPRRSCCWSSTGWAPSNSGRGADLAPVLSSGSGGPITSVAPSTTACALTTLVTGRGARRARRGRLPVGARREGDERPAVVDRRGRRPDDGAGPRVPARPFVSRAPQESVPVVTRYDYGPTGFTAAHLGQVDLHRWHTPAGLVTTVRHLAATGSPFVYAYYEGIDKVAHAEGLGDYYDDELRAADRLVADVLEVLPPGAALVVTADHGQVDVGNSVEVLGPEVMDGLTLISGEGRFRWLHARPGATAGVADAATDLHGDVAWVRPRNR